MARSSSRPPAPSALLRCAALLVAVALAASGCAGEKPKRGKAPTPAAVSGIGFATADAFHDSIGINAHLGGQGAVDPARFARIRALLQEAGFRYSRGKVTKGNAQRARDLWQCCRIQTLARIDSRAGDSPQGEVEVGGIGSALDLALSIGSEAIVGFEGPNEYTRHHNTGDWNQDLRSYVQRTAEAIRGRGLGQTIVGPTVYLRREADVRAIGDLSPWIDASAFHIYTGGMPPSTELDGYLADARLMAPGKPVWVTEYGFHNAVGDPSSNPVSELASAKYLPRFAALLFQASPEGKHFIYNFVDEGSDRSVRIQNFGLVRNDLSKKPAYYAMQRLIAAVKDAGPIAQPTPLDVRLSGDTAGVRSLVLQRAAKDYVVLLWQEAMSWDKRSQQDDDVGGRAVTVTVPTAASFRLSDTLPSPADPSREAAPVSLGSGTPTVAVTVPDHIVMLEIRT